MHFINKAICVNDKPKCTSVAEGFWRCTYVILMCANPMNCLRKKREFVTNLYKGPRLGIRELYIVCIEPIPISAAKIRM